jgi:hypothetical protein
MQPVLLLLKIIYSINKMVHQTVVVNIKAINNKAGLTSGLNENPCFVCN